MKTTLKDLETTIRYWKRQIKQFSKHGVFHENTIFGMGMMIKVFEKLLDDKRDRPQKEEGKD